MKMYPGEYICKKCKMRNHKFLRCLCWAKDDSDWPHKKDKGLYTSYSFVSTCTIQVEWPWDESIIEDYRHREDEDWGYDIDYIPEVIVMNQNNPFSYTVWTPEDVAYNLQHAVRAVCRYTEDPRWKRYHVLRCGNVTGECRCCCGDDVREDEFKSMEEMREFMPKEKKK